MSKTLVIVESPGKIKKIKSILGNDYIIKASVGHILGLQSDNLSIDVEDNFKPNYIILSDKKKVVKDLKDSASKCKDVIIASDQDREGEMIAESIAKILKLKNPKRILFNEITEKALTSAIKSPTTINYNLVYAQQARRLLDRLVGYKISPILWKHIKSNSSAGRVQSAVLKIIIDKENDIMKSVSESFFKSNGKFNNLQTNLLKGSEIYKFPDYDTGKTFIEKIDKKCVYKVANIKNKETKRKPPVPFITSSLQQEASTKLHFNVKLTMSIAQKLYEAGFITYMRTDSISLSSTAINQCKKYIINNYGENYSNPKKYINKGKNAQEAHEAIRPSKIEVTSVKGKLDDKCDRLYNLIWKRTVASQMKEATIELQTINIDIIRKEKSILPNTCFYQTTNEKVIFDGFLILYENLKNTFVDIKENDLLKLKLLEIVEDYPKPPFRYNEANLVKYLENKGIGRPSTYASIISKIQERQYVEIKDIEGEKKKSQVININDKLIIKEAVKEVSIGNEKKKLTPTELGITVNKFMEENFSMIINQDYTANFEKYLDKIAEGKEEWVNVLDKYYKQFNPIVEKLQAEKSSIKELTKTDEFLGKHPKNNKDIYCGNGKYGDYVKIQDDNGKWKFAHIENKKELTLAKAIELLTYPKLIGKIGNSNVTINKGKYGLYLKRGTDNISIEEEVDIKKAIELFKNHCSTVFKYKHQTVYVRKGQYGPYLQVKTKTKSKNISLPNNVDINSIDKQFLDNFFASKEV